MKKILYIENDTEQLALYVRLLRQEQFEVVTAISGQEALEKLVAWYQAVPGKGGEVKYKRKEGGIDLVVTDMDLPHMDGVELLTSIFNIDNGLPVIIFSGFEHYKDNYMTWTVEGYVTKGKVGDVEELLATIRKVLDSNESKEEGTGQAS